MKYIFSAIIILIPVLILWYRDIQIRSKIFNLMKKQQRTADIEKPEIEVFIEKKRVSSYQTVLNNNKQLEYELREKLKKENRL